MLSRLFCLIYFDEEIILNTFIFIYNFYFLIFYSDKNSPCCQNCRYLPAGNKCRDAQYATCEQESRCSGKGAECPKSAPMTDGTTCLEKGKCRMGKCIPYCETQNLLSCMCDTSKKKCHLPIKICYTYLYIMYYKLTKYKLCINIINFISCIKFFLSKRLFFFISGGDACKRCCRMNLNETCFPVTTHDDILPDGTPCIHGFCNKVLNYFYFFSILNKQIHMLQKKEKNQSIEKKKLKCLFEPSLPQ